MIAKWRLRIGASLLYCSLSLCVAHAAPNIVFIMTDDMKPNLVQEMPKLQALASQGATFTRAYYNVPLCEPSRATILTGSYVQNTKADNSYATFRDNGNNDRTYAVWLQQAGYLTAHIGKYINGFNGAIP